MLHEVPETALITLRSRVIESGKSTPLMNDPAGEDLFARLLETLSEDIKKRIINRKLSSVLTRYLAHRARKYDNLCREFLAEFPDGLVVNLGCGFDTRYWRLEIPAHQYLELDLPEVVDLKQKAFGDKIDYRILGGSVLDGEWISEVKSIQTGRILFLAEGLFMYFEKDLAIGTLQRIAESFEQSRLVMEVVAEKYTRGFRKKMVEQKMKRGTGSSAGESFRFGMKKAAELETYHPRFRLKGEWSYFEDHDIRPVILKLFRHFRSLSKTQYTVIADIVSS